MFTISRHIRLAGCVSIFVGLYLHSWGLILSGNLAIATAYMLSIAKIERYIEEKEKHNAVHSERD